MTPASLWSCTRIEFIWDMWLFRHTHLENQLSYKVSQKKSPIKFFEKLVLRSFDSWHQSTCALPLQWPSVKTSTPPRERLEGEKSPEWPENILRNIALIPRIRWSPGRCGAGKFMREIKPIFLKIFSGYSGLFFTSNCSWGDVEVLTDGHWRGGAQIGWCEQSKLLKTSSSKIFYRLLEIV